MIDRSRRKWLKAGLATGTAVVTALHEKTNLEAQVKQSTDEGRNRSLPMPDLDDKKIDELIEKAKAASRQAYCPYSKFPVGAAVLTDDGHIFAGCNVENASYGLTICAERNAAFQMAAQGKRKIVAAAVYTPTKKPASPCGACRQVLNEFGPDALVISVCESPDRLKKRLTELLPNAFGPANLD